MSLFLFYSAPVDRGTRTASACSFYPGDSLFLHRLCGGTSCVSNTPLTGGAFFAEPQRVGSCRAPRRGQKGRDTCGFPSSLNSYLSLVRQSGAYQRPATAPKQGGRQRDFFFRRGAQCAPITQPIRNARYRTATHTVKSAQARHDSVAQPFNTLYRTAPMNLDIWYHLSS